MSDNYWESTQLERTYEVKPKDIVKNKALIYSAWTSPFLLSLVPALILFVMSFIFGVTPPIAATFIFFAVISLVVGFVTGLVVSGGLLIYRQKWLSQVREKLAVDGIKTEEVEWFKQELTTIERKSLKELETKDRLLGDAYRETLASRLTATRIIKSTKEENLLIRRRQNRLVSLKTDASLELQKTLKDDAEKLQKIQNEANQMKMEAETRLQLIEAASRRGHVLADNETALRKLTARSAELPLALEALKIDEEFRKELESADD